MPDLAKTLADIGEIAEESGRLHEAVRAAAPVNRLELIEDMARHNALMARHLYVLASMLRAARGK